MTTMPTGRWSTKDSVQSLSIFFFGWGLLFVLLLSALVLLTGRFRQARGAGFSRLSAPERIAIWATRIAIALWFIGAFILGRHFA